MTLHSSMGEKKIAPVAIHWCLLSVYGDQAVDQAVDVIRLKGGLLGQDFLSDDAVVAAVKQWITSTGTDFCECGMQVKMLS